MKSVEKRHQHSPSAKAVVVTTAANARAHPQAKISVRNALPWRVLSLKVKVTAEISIQVSLHFSAADQGRRTMVEMEFLGDPSTNLSL